MLTLSPPLPLPSPQVQAAYDRMSAHELFLRFGLSDRLVDDFIRPTLLVGLFKPPEELSALVVMVCAERVERPALRLLPPLPSAASNARQQAAAAHALEGERGCAYV